MSRSGPGAGPAWTTPADVRAAVEREWRSGRLLAARVPAYAVPEGRTPARATAFPLRVPVRGPTAAELGTRFDDVRRWADALRSGRGYRVEDAVVTTRALGRQTVPVAAVVDEPGHALALLGRRREAADFDALVAVTPAPFRWFAAARPLEVLEVGAEWPAVVAVADWLRAPPDPGIHVRQVDLPGVHTKVVERHRRTIAALVDGGAPRAPVGTLAAFETAYGFARKPTYVRYRVLDPAAAPVPGLSDVTAPVAEVAATTPRVERVVVVENEVTFLALPPLRGALALWGGGNRAPETLREVGWLRGVDVAYWGDLDTHGFAILDRLRAELPHVRSLLMDADTLLAHREAWGREEQPVRRDLPHLTDDEAYVYGSLCSDVWAERVRLEQERIRFGAVRRALGTA